MAHAVLIAKKEYFKQVQPLPWPELAYCHIGTVASLIDLDGNVVSYLVSITQNTAQNMTEAKFQIKNIDDGLATSDRFAVYAINGATDRGQECTYVDMRTKTIEIERCNDHPMICEVIFAKRTRDIKRD
ncbi:hypothetical protein DPMN_190848 [Dreissena polymorpha]|uniref:Uncharacterized protein n=1 Tax=Dreissena polymorpha TaxID=45954 RepID=A0A9D4BCP1_DREPO|nr:hypothetical protein DPMN_190848 [Dreissena polymorpha]